MSILRYLYNLILKIKNNKEYESLAPISTIKKNATLDMLINAVGDSKNYNIALSGKYGAGKSSIIRSFFKGFKNIIYKPLYISLGMLNLKEEGIKVNEFCQQIEKSIIQQIIYKENTASLPDSNIKRVSKLKKRNIVYIMIFIAILIAVKINSLYIENYNEEIKNLIEKYFVLNIWYRIVIGVALFIIILCIAKFIAKFLKKVDIKNIKFNFSNTEIAIQKTSTESLINKYMDELVYFFSMTHYNVVIIEDLDRFVKNVEIREKVLIIFQKLKELNQILNSSKQIRRKIVFIYVVKDDLFNNEEERTKFFDAIIPVIPIISNYNSYAELKNRFEVYDIDDKIIQEISPYINDFRVVKNLKNEFELYQKEITGKEIIKEKQLAMIALKNIRPKEYENLLNNEGLIYDIIHKKEELIKIRKERINDRIDCNQEKIIEYRKEKSKSVEELKRLTISNLYGKKATRSISGALSAEEFLSESIDYDELRNTNIYLQDSRGYCFTETEIFEYFGGKDKFLEEINNITRANEIEIDKLIIENTKYKKEKEDLDKKPFYELLSDEKEIKIEDGFIKMLLIDGYIDESYQDYMFKYIETKDINKHDYTFISNVRQHINTKYDYSINNVEKVVEQLDLSFFGTEAILNYYVLDFLITHHESQIYEKENNCIDMLTELNENRENFIFGFIKYTQNKSIFLTKLYEKNENTIYEILINNRDKIDDIELIIKNILNIPELLKHEKTNNFIKNYITNKDDISSWIELNENVKKSLILLDVKFKNLEKNDINILEFVYNNNLYKLDSKMIAILFEYKGFSKQDFEEKNLSIIMHDEELTKLKSYVYENKNEYISNCYLETLGKQNDIEDVIECINEWDISNERKKEIIKSIGGKIKNIKDIDTNYYEEFIKNNKVEPTWENYYYFYCKNDNKITDELLRNIELNIEDIKKRSVLSVILPEEEKEEFINFRAKILKNNNLDLDVYKQIIPLCCINLGSVEEDEIEDERLKLLVESRTINFNNDNLQIIYNQVPESLDIYINNNIELFTSGIKNYTINEYMIYDIVKSSIIKYREKNKIINSIDVSYINEESLEYIIDNYSFNRISKINENLKEKMFQSTLNMSYKLTLLEKELDRNTPEDLIDNYLKLLPEPYKNIADYEEYNKGFSIPKTKVNERILEKLENKGFRFTKALKKNRIMIYNKK